MKFVLIALIGAIYLNAENNFNKEHTANNESFNRVISKNKAHLNVGNASYVEINGKDELKKAIKSGELGKTVDANKVTNTYRNIDIKNVRMNQNDFKDIKRDRILIGSRVGKNREKLVQTINIKNSRIHTNKQLNIGIISNNCRVQGLRHSSNIRSSSFKGRSRKKKRSSNTSRIDRFEEL